jgi:uncharacterized protein (DUF983 family)
MYETTCPHCGDRTTRGILALFLACLTCASTQVRAAQDDL